MMRRAFSAAFGRSAEKKQAESAEKKQAESAPAAPEPSSAQKTTHRLAHHRPTIFYHGTSVEAALAIQEKGFDPERSGTNAGALLGKGVYCTTTLEKAMHLSLIHI